MASIASGAFPLPLAETPMLALLLQNRVCVGFPSPAEVLGAQHVDLTQMLVVHAQATYLLCASGHSMQEAGIWRWPRRRRFRRVGC